jgi:hypothetical protein
VKKADHRRVEVAVKKAGGCGVEAVKRDITLSADPVDCARSAGVQESYVER